MKDKLVENDTIYLRSQIMKKFVRLRAKTYNCFKDNNNEGKKAKRTKKCVMKRKLKFINTIEMFKSISN